MRIRKYFIESIKLSILFSGLSVSISQLFLAVAFILFFFQKLRFQQTPIFIASLFLFGTYLFSAAYHFIISGMEMNYLQLLAKSELKDIFLFAGFLVMQALDKEDFEKIGKAFTWLMVILVLTGFISIFSKYRLSRLISDLYSVSTTWQFQHHQGTIANVHFYLPIGMMNTHLTFGGLLLFFFPFAFFNLIHSFANKGFSKTTFSFGLFFIAYIIVFLLNNARSALGGAAIGILIGLYHTLFIIKRKIPGYIVKTGIIAVIFISVLPFLYNNPNIKKVILPLLGEEKHTDSGRTFIWNSTFPMFLENPFTGIGPGNYNSEVEKIRKQQSEENNRLLYFYEITQRGHAHNDFFHLLAIAGFPAFIAYLLLSMAVTYTLIKLPDNKWQALFYALPGFFFAGLLQCYFQDDEVVIVFWLLTGFMSALYKTSSKTSAIKQA